MGYKNFAKFAGVVVVAFAILYALNMFASDRNGAVPNSGTLQVEQTNTQEDFDDEGKEEDAGGPPGFLNELPDEGAPVAQNNAAENELSTDKNLKDLRTASCFPKSQLTPEQLLPAEQNEWGKTYPSGTGTLKDKNFLQSGHHVGINTVGQTMRNANLQLRSEPPNPQVKVSPWLQTTIDPDVNRRPMEIGGCN